MKALKLFTMHCEIGPFRNVGLYAVAESQEEAQTLVLSQIKTPEYKAVVQKHFEDGIRMAVYDNPTAIIKHQGADLII